MIYNSSELSKFIINLKKIVNEIEKNENEGEDNLVIFNKLHFYAQEFFVNNELAYQKDSDKLNEIKKANKSFFNQLQKIQPETSDINAKTLQNLKNFLIKWIENNNKI